MRLKNVREWIGSLRARKTQEEPRMEDDIDDRWWKEGLYRGLFRGDVAELPIDVNDLSGVLRIHARSMRDVGDRDRPGLMKPGHAWLEYRGALETITFSKKDLIYRDTERDLCGEAVREKSITHEQGRLFLDVVSRRARLTIERGFFPENDPLDTSKFAALIWRVVTGEALRSDFKGFSNVTTLAVAIERMNSRDRLVGFRLDPFRRVMAGEDEIAEQVADNDEELERER